MTVVQDAATRGRGFKSRQCNETFGREHGPSHRVILRGVVVWPSVSLSGDRMLTTEQLDNWFTYHPPTDETRPKYAAILDAQRAAALAFHNAPGKADRSAAFFDVNATTRFFVEVIDANAPDSADKTAAIRCVRLARNAINEALVSFDTEHRLLFDVAIAELLKARWQANSAIACGGR